MSAASTDEIYERYLQKAIGEINELWTELRSLGDAIHIPVLGSGKLDFTGVTKLVQDRMAAQAKAPVAEAAVATAG